MGLAASQGRLLTITARKADCEYQSMSLSHQKIALSRDMERISDEYQDAMGKTKLVYDFYGTGTSQMGLNYSLLMTPSVYNDYYPKLITDNQNRAVLSPEYAAAAKEAGIPHEGFNGLPSSEIRNAFVESLCNHNIITPTTAMSIENVSYNNAIGLGQFYSANVATMDITYADLLEMIHTNCTTDTKDYGLYFGGVPKDNGGYIDIELSMKQTDHMGPTELVDCSDLLVFNGGDKASEWYGVSHTNTNKGLDLYTLLTSENHYVLSFDGGNGIEQPLCEAALAQQAIVGNDYTPSFLNWLVDQFATVLGGVTENEQALQYAYNAVVDLIYPNESIQNLAKVWQSRGWTEMSTNHQKNKTKHNPDNCSALLSEIGTQTQSCWKSRPVQEVAKDAQNYIGFTYSSCWSASSESRASISIDLNNLTDVFLTAFVEYFDEKSNYSYRSGQKTNGTGATAANLYKPENSDIFTIAAPIDVDNGEDDLVPSFYDAMFNLICVNGWTENENIGDAEYLQELLKSGAVYISSIDNDAYYYQSSYSTDSYIHEVPDTDAIASAEAAYNAKKARIENKENTIDMKMKNLDTEISALTTEYDTMQKVITKSIEKSFKRYEA